MIDELEDEVQLGYWIKSLYMELCHKGKHGLAEKIKSTAFVFRAFMNPICIIPNAQNKNVVMVNVGSLKKIYWIERLTTDLLVGGSPACLQQAGVLGIPGVHSIIIFAPIV